MCLGKNTSQFLTMVLDTEVTLSSAISHSDLLSQLIHKSSD